MEGAISSDAIAPRVAAEHCIRAFTGSLGVGDLDGATASFARDACLVTPDATSVRGRNSIRAVLAQLILVRTEFVDQVASLVMVDDAALFRGRWTIRSNGVGGARFEQVANPILVAQRIEAEWRLRIAALWG
jgi:ketosteroid isomerase-like protein